MDMAKIVMLRLPEKVAEKIQKIADRKSIGLSTAIREIVCEHFAPAETLPKTAAGTARTTA